MSIPMPCCMPQANFPRPNDRRAADRPRPVNNAAVVNGRLVQRRPTYFSPALRRVSALVQDPASASLRELAVLALVGIALYQGVPAARRVYDLVAVTDAAELCWRGRSLLGCSADVGWMVLWVLYGWAAGWVPWGFVLALGAFVGEEIMAAMKRK